MCKDPEPDRKIAKKSQTVFDTEFRVIQEMKLIFFSLQTFYLYLPLLNILYIHTRDGINASNLLVSKAV